MKRLATCLARILIRTKRGEEAMREANKSGCVKGDVLKANEAMSRGALGRHKNLAHQIRSR